MLLVLKLFFGFMFKPTSLHHLSTLFSSNYYVTSITHHLPPLTIFISSCYNFFRSLPGFTICFRSSSTSLHPLPLPSFFLCSFLPSPSTFLHSLSPFTLYLSSSYLPSPSISLQHLPPFTRSHILLSTILYHQPSSTLNLLHLLPFPSFYITPPSTSLHPLPQSSLYLPPTTPL